MKKLLLLVMIAIFAAGSMQAQTEKGDMAIGVNITPAFGDGWSTVGIGVKYQYNIIDHLRMEPNVNYYFKKDYTSVWDLGVNFHWLFNVIENLHLYPIAGIGVAGASFDIEGAYDDVLGEDFGDYMEGSNTSITRFAFNLGAGVEYMFTDNISANFEYKRRISSDLGQNLISIGVGYHF